MRRGVPFAKGRVKERVVTDTIDHVCCALVKRSGERWAVHWFGCRSGVHCVGFGEKAVSRHVRLSPVTERDGQMQSD